MSVVIPTYRRPHLIARALRSVLAQTFGDYEIIVVNDGPPDGTREAVEAFGDARIRYLEHPRNRGISAARNTGIAAARGAYVAFLDSDDEWLPGKLEQQIAAFASAPPEVGVVYTERLSTSDNATFHVPRTHAGKRSGDIHASLLQGSFITPQTAMVQARCFAVAGVFDESLHHLEDWELWLRMSRHFHFLFVEEPLVRVYAEQGSASSNHANLIQALSDILVRHRADFEAGGGRVIGAQHYYLGRLLGRAGRWREARRHLLRAARAHPFEPRYVVAAILSLLRATTASRPE